VVSMFRVDAGAVSKLGDGPVGPNAHVVAVDPETRRSYFPLKNLSGRTMLRILEPERKGQADSVGPTKASRSTSWSVNAAGA
jgi:hypothetical protein